MQNSREGTGDPLAMRADRTPEEMDSESVAEFEATELLDFLEVRMLATGGREPGRAVSPFQQELLAIRAGALLLEMGDFRNRLRVDATPMTLGDSRRVLPFVFPLLGLGGLLAGLGIAFAGYKVGKLADKVGDAVEDIRDAVERVADAVVSVTQHIDQVLSEIQQLIAEIKKLVQQIQGALEEIELKKALSDVRWLVEVIETRIKDTTEWTQEKIDEIRKLLEDLQRNVHRVWEFGGTAGALAAAPGTAAWVQMWAFLRRVDRANGFNSVGSPWDTGFHRATVSSMSNYLSMLRRTTDDYESRMWSLPADWGEHRPPIVYSFDGRSFNQENFPYQSRYEPADGRDNLFIAALGEPGLADPTRPLILLGTRRAGTSPQPSAPPADTWIWAVAHDQSAKNVKFGDARRVAEAASAFYTRSTYSLALEVTRFFQQFGSLEAAEKLLQENLINRPEGW